MSASWSIKAEWEPLDSGEPEERACFAALGIYAYGTSLTEGSDALANRLRQAPLLSAYHFAEWLAWNWWRLRWEPRSNVADWAYAHRVSTIGGGYIWPNLTIFSDGQRTALLAKPTEERSRTPFRYITDRAAIISASEFESELDLFIEQVLERLQWANITNSNLKTVWEGVCEERRTPELARARKLEALLGNDPDESDPLVLEALVSDAEQLGFSGVEELAAEHGQSGDILTATDLRDIATQSGFDASPRDTVRLSPVSDLPRVGQVAAWRLGAAAAKELRKQQKIADEPITDDEFARMVGVKTSVITDRKGGPGISFALDESSHYGRIVLRSKWHNGRRFELARLLADRLLSPKDTRLFPATRANTYRQKLQRSFAAEFLSPFEAVDERLGNDYSIENQMDVAEHFGVSELTVRTLLVNHGRLEREDLYGELETAAA